MSRNSSGTYGLPAGNPVVGGTTIATTWANSTLGDLAAEMTDSLCRSGKGGMLAPLKVDPGTVAAPGVTWDVDPDSGLYRVGANSVGMGAGSTQIQRWETTGTTITGTLAVSGATTLSAALSGTSGVFTSGATVTTGVSNGAGITTTGNGTAGGVNATGGATSGPGVSGTGGAPNGYGGSFVGTGIGVGVEGQGGTGGAGGLFRPGTAATATVRQKAVEANNGDLTFSGVVNPNSNVAFANTLAAMNTPKAWALVSINGSGAVALDGGFNITSVAIVASGLGFGNVVRVTFASAFSSTTFGPQLSSVTPQPGPAASRMYVGGSRTTTTLDVLMVDSAGAYVNPSANAGGFMLTCFGAQ